TVEEGSSVTLVVGVEPETVEMPDLVGDNVDDAVRLLEAVGLVPKKEERSDRRIPDNVVISQNPAPLIAVNKGAEVTIVVSTGPARNTVPDVVNQDQVDAAAALTEAGFKFRRVNEPSSQFESERVIRTEPAAGTELSEGETVTMVVSTGPEKVTVPSLIGKTAEAAKAELESAGLVYREGVPALANPADDGKVVSQSPSGGTDVDPGSTVTVRIGRAAVSSTTTTTEG
ncbi:MAG TPA: PASTA domain-containing protein, partial [Acidimicrobiales bacterium]|nr:PASTA domain-containing protein [Acidimicrobiales bacterium]